MMTTDRFGYQYEKLAQARSTLMAPHPGGEERSFASAFELCARALHRFDVSRLDDENALACIDIIKRLMDTEGVIDPTGEGTYVHRARALTPDERREFSNAVDELASFFGRHFWSGG